MTYNKNMIYKLLFLFSFTLLTIDFASAQDTKEELTENKAATIAKLINDRDFVFVAQFANPMAGRTIQLNSFYDVSVSGDKVSTFLPYFGRAYIAPINPSEGGIRFTSTDFDYSVKDRKKGGWEIEIVPKDGRDVRQMFLTVSENGFASLQIVSNNRQPISFNGYITERKK